MILTLPCPKAFDFINPKVMKPLPGFSALVRRTRKLNADVSEEQRLNILRAQSGSEKTRKSPQSNHIVNRSLAKKETFVESSKILAMDSRIPRKNSKVSPVYSRSPAGSVNSATITNNLMQPGSTIDISYKFDDGSESIFTHDSVLVEDIPQGNDAEVSKKSVRFF